MINYGSDWNQVAGRRASRIGSIVNHIICYPNMYKAIMSTLKLPLEGRGLPNRRKPLIRHRGQNSTSRCSLDSVLHHSLSLETARNSCSRHKSQIVPPSFAFSAPVGQTSDRVLAATDCLSILVTSSSTPLLPV